MSVRLDDVAAGRCATSRATTSASRWPSCCTKKEGRGGVGGDDPGRVRAPTSSHAQLHAAGDRRHRAADRAGRWPRRWKSSRSGRSARAWAPRTSPRLYSVPRLLAIAAFICAYYLLFRQVILDDRVGFQPAVPGGAAVDAAGNADLARHAAIALTLGMAIEQSADQRTRARGTSRPATPQLAIHTGYERAWGTILDSNHDADRRNRLSPSARSVRGFAVVRARHPDVNVSRCSSRAAWSNLWYGRQKRLKSVSIGQIWRPTAACRPTKWPTPNGGKTNGILRIS